MNNLVMNETHEVSLTKIGLIVVGVAQGIISSGLDIVPPSTIDEMVLKLAVIVGAEGAVVRRDTVTAAYDSPREKSNDDGYANGFEQYITTTEKLNLLTGKDTVLKIVSIIPKI